MKVTFWLLDLNHEVKDDRPEIWLWGITDSGERVLIIDRDFLMYFYAVVAEGVDPAKVVDEIGKGHFACVSKVEIVERRFFGKPVKAVRIYCTNPDAVSKCARQLREVEGVKECLEDDIRYAMRYLIDNNVVPCGWHEAEATEETNWGP